MDLEMHIVRREQEAVKFKREHPTREGCLREIGYDKAKKWGVLDEYKKAMGWAFSQECK